MYRVLNDYATLKGLSISAGSSFDGSGNSSTSESLTAQITARVIDVMPNGNLVIKGERRVKMKQEEVHIVMTGMIRPDDISRNEHNQFILYVRCSYFFMKQQVTSQMEPSRESSGEFFNLSTHFKEQNMKRIAAVFLILVFLGLTVQANTVVRIKDVARIQGQEDYFVTGFGIVIGLAGSGDSDKELTQHSLKRMLNHFQLEISEEELKVQNCGCGSNYCSNQWWFF